MEDWGPGLPVGEIAGRTPVSPGPHVTLFLSLIVLRR